MAPAGERNGRQTGGRGLRTLGHGEGCAKTGPPPQRHLLREGHPGPAMDQRGRAGKDHRRQRASGSTGESLVDREHRERRGDTARSIMATTSDGGDCLRSGAANALHVTCISWWSGIDCFSTFVGRSPGLFPTNVEKSPGKVATPLPGHVFCNIGNFFDGSVRERVGERVLVNTHDKDFLRPNFPHTPIESRHQMAKSGSARFPPTFSIKVPVYIFL